MGNKVALHNLGCKVNAYEIEAMQQLLEEAGYEIVPFEPGADIYVINTCTVTNIADRKSRQMLHKAKKMNPEAIVVATGCYVQTGGEKLEKDEAIDLVLGNNQKINIVEALAEYAENKPGHGSHVIKINQTKEYEELSIDHTAEHVRAYIKVQDGCNQFCTYCIIPYARGRVRSRNIESVLKEVRALAEKGYKEVVLTGIHLSSYGVDFPEEKKETLLSLIRAVHEIEGIRRIRLGSLEPGIVTREFAEGIAALPKVCPHFHLSLQRGCDETPVSYTHLNQTAVDINVVQGERQFAKDNKSLGQFRLDGIPPARRGVPQIEVTFDIDANGIVNVSAKDLGTGKEQHITITAGSNMSDSDIDKAVKEAAEFEAQDKKRKEAIDTRNNADSMVFQVENALKEAGDKLDANDKASVEADLNALKDLLAQTANAQELTDSQVADIKAAQEKMMESAQKLFSKMYEQTQGAQGQAGPGPDMGNMGGNAGAQGGNEAGYGDDVVDADYKEV